MTKCTKCKRMIKGKIAYKGTKPYCSDCFYRVKEGIKNRENAREWWKKQLMLQKEINKSQEV